MHLYKNLQVQVIINLGRHVGKCNYFSNNDKFIQITWEYVYKHYFFLKQLLLFFATLCQLFSPPPPNKPY